MFNFINKLLWPHRVAKKLPCNIGFWWFIPALVNALGSIGGAIGAGAGAIGSAIGAGAGAIGSAAGAIGSGIGSAASAIGSGIGSALGIGGGSGAAAASTAGGFAGTSAGMAGSAGAIGSGTATGSAAASAAASTAALTGSAAGSAVAAPIGSSISQGLAAGQTAQAAGLQMTPGGLMAPVSSNSVAQIGGSTIGKEVTAKAVAEKTLMDKLGEQVLSAGVSKMTEGAGPQPAPAMGATNTDNSISMSSPQTGDAGPAPTSGGNNQTSLSPEQMMQLVQMMKKQQAQGGTRPIASGNQFPGGYY